MVISGTVMSVDVNFYTDSTMDTELTLTDGRRVFFPGIAPISASRKIRAIGEVHSCGKILRAIHPAISHEGLSERLKGVEEGFYAVSIEDAKAEVSYCKRSSLSAGITV